MSPRSGPAPSEDASLLEDFEWPPKADELSIHEIAAEPWRSAKAEPPATTTVRVTVTLDEAAAVPVRTRRTPWRRNR